MATMKRAPLGIGSRLNTARCLRHGGWVPMMRGRRVVGEEDGVSLCDAKPD